MLSFFTEKNDLLLIAHPAEKDFAKPLYNRLETEKLKVFYDEESIEWGEDMYTKLEEALRGEIVYGALLVVSESLLERPEPDLKRLIGAVYKMPISIFPLLHGVSVETFRERMPLLKSVDVDGSLVGVDDIDALARKISDVFHRPRQKRDELQPKPLPSLVFNFEGRTTELNDIFYKIRAGTSVVTVTGLPGSGKSQFVIALGRRFAHLHWTVVYVDMTLYSTENKAAAAILFAMNEKLSLGQESEILRLQEVVGKLSSSSSRLIILNRCDKLVKSRLDLLRRLLRILAPVFQIVTTSAHRFDTFEPHGEPFCMSPLDVDVAAGIILARLNSKDYKEITPEKAHHLAKLCGGMPMAIHLLISGLQRGLSEDDMSESDRQPQVRFLDYLDEVSTAVEFDGISVMIEAIYTLLPKPLQRHLICLNLFQLPFTKDDAANLLCLERKKAIRDVLVPLVDCSLLTHVAFVDTFYLHTLVCQYLRRKYKVGPAPREAQLQYVTLTCFKLRIAVDKYEVNAVEAIELFDSNRANYKQLSTFADAFDVADVSKENIRLAADAAPLLRAVVSPDDRRRVFKLCGKAAEAKGDWQSYILFEMRALETVLESFASVLSDDDISCLTRATEKAKEIENEPLLIECFLIKARHLMAQKKFDSAFSILMRDALGQPSSLADQLLAASCNSALGAVAENVDGSQSAIQFYEKAKNFFQFLWHSGYKCPPHPDICSIQLQMARCFFSNRNFNRSIGAYSKVLEGQRALSCNSISLLIVRHHMAIAKVFDGWPNLTKINLAVRDLREIDEEMSGSQHPLKAWNSLAIGKILFLIEANTKRWLRRGKAIVAFKEATTYFNQALDVRETVFIYETDCTELSVECHAYLFLIDKLLEELGEKDTNAFRIDHREECQKCAKRLTTQLCPFVKLVAENDKEKKSSKFKETIQALLRKRIPNFTDCFCVVQRWCEMRRKSESETGRSYSFYQQQVSPSRSLSLSMIKLLVYPAPDRTSRSINRSASYCHGLSL